MAILITFKDILLVSIGAVLGVNARFLIYHKFKKININEHIIILAINTLSSFLVGLFITILPKIRSDTFSSQLVLFFLIGFLGSLSTFSTFVYDLFELSLKLKFFRALKIFTLSFSLGIISLAFGCFLGDQ